MKTNFLLPHQFKSIGWFIFVPALTFGIFFLIFEWEPSWLNLKTFAIFGSEYIFSSQEPGVITDNLLNEILGVAIIVGGMFVALSKELDEDELIQKIRLESILWATIWNYSILLFAILFIYGGPFFTVMMINMFTVLVLFIIRFNWKLFKLRKSLGNEE